MPVPQPGVIVAAFDQGRVALVKRGKEPYEGWWALPGGSLEPGESPEEAARRELAEETCLIAGQVMSVGLVEPIQRDGNGNVVRHFVLTIFAATEFAGALVAADDACEAGWFSKRDAGGMRLVPRTLECIEMAASVAGFRF